MKDRKFTDDLADALILSIISLAIMFCSFAIGAILSFLLK